MQSRIVEIADNNRHVALHRGFLVVRSKGEDADEIGRIPLDDINAVIAHAHGLSYTNNLLVALAKRGVPFVLCGANHSPVGMLWPVDGQHLQAGRMDAQIHAGRPLKKRLWAQTVRAKLLQQAAILQAWGLPETPLTALVPKVRSGDPANLEGQAAQRYWPLLMDKAFRRDQAAGGHNAQLNYGYMVLRSATARAVIAAGLHPTIGLFHQNQGNPMRLVDDLMEPFRPLVDHRVRTFMRDGREELSATTKRALAQCLYLDLQTRESLSPVFVCMQRAATSLAQTLIGEKSAIEYPSPWTGDLVELLDWDD